MTQSVNLNCQNNHNAENHWVVKKVANWIYEHPATIKILKISGLALGAGLLFSTPLNTSQYSLWTSLRTAATGAFVLSLSSAAHFALDIYIPPHHDMKRHVYQEGEYQGSRLYYEGDIPILSLNSNDPFQAGKAHGYLCAEAIDQVYQRLLFSLRFIEREETPENLSQFLNQIRERVPDRYLSEMEGIVEGYSLWAQQQPWWKSPTKLTGDNLLYFHLLPDLPHLPLASANGIEKNGHPIGCSALVNYNPEGGLTFARNLDWPSSGVLGTYSLMINRLDLDGCSSTLEASFPSLVGTVTGMNHQGLCLAMNSLPPVIGLKSKSLPEGLPTLFFNRSCLEKCKNLQDIERSISHQSLLAPYFLTSADREQAASFQLSPQAAPGEYSYKACHLRDKNTPLVRLNSDMTLRNFKHSKPHLQNTQFHPDHERLASLDTFFTEKGDEPLENALALPFVNHGKTIHRIIMEPETRVFKVAFDNAFAGKAPLHSLSTQQLFNPG